MPGPEYYRRQSEICLRLALLNDDAHATYWLVEMAKGLQARADEADCDPERDSASDQHRVSVYLMDSDEPPDGGRDRI